VQQIQFGMDAKNSKIYKQRDPMSKIKTVTDSLTGEEINKKQSKLVAGHRVSRENESVAKSILIDAVTVFVEMWKKHDKTVKNRLSGLAYCAAIIESCKKHHDCDPTAFVVEIAKQCEEAGDPLHEAFIKKLLDYTEGEQAFEFKQAKVQKALWEGFMVLEHAIKLKG
jgi:hypothetical protein